MPCSRARVVVALAFVGLVPGCASAPVQPPTLQVAGVKVGDVGLTGVSLEVKFRVRNPNQKAVKIDRFDYELVVNGQRLGKGFQPHGVKVEAYQDEEVVSRFDLNLLSLPGVVKSVLGEKQADAHVEGLFYIKGQDPVPFASDARIDLTRR